MDFMHFEGPTFTMQVPTNWFVASSPQIQAIFSAPEQEQGMQANLVVTLRPVQDDVTAADVAHVADRTQRQEYQEYEALEERITHNTDTLTAVRRVYRWFNTEHDIAILQRQALYIHENRLYTLTATRPLEAANEETIDQIFEKMLDSFTLKALS